MNSRLERENWFLPKITLKAQQRPPKEEVHSFQRPMAINEEPMNGRTLSNLKVHQIKVSNPVWNCLAMVCGVGWVLCICSRFFQFNWTCNSTAFLKGATHKWYLIFRKGGGYIYQNWRSSDTGQWCIFSYKSQFFPADFENPSLGNFCFPGKVDINFSKSRKTVLFHLVSIFDKICFLSWVCSHGSKYLASPKILL